MPSKRPACCCSQRRSAHPGWMAYSLNGGIPGGGIQPLAQGTVTVPLKGALGLAMSFCPKTELALIFPILHLGKLRHRAVMLLD